MRWPRLPLRLRVIALLLTAGTLAVRGCTPADDSPRTPRYVQVVGIDVSGSFRNSESYENSIDFLAHYIYGHLNGLGDLQEPTALFVGSVGGDASGETKAFHPIHDFQDKSVDQIADDLRAWFPVEDRLTDFNAFFRRASELVKRQGLVLAPMNIVLLSDGVPDLTLQADSLETPYEGIDLGPLEYLSRSITVRLLYPEPTVAAGWERGITRRRVRIWTTNHQVMAGWRAQVDPEVPLERQDALWTWISDNVDFRVRSRML